MKKTLIVLFALSIAAIAQEKTTTNTAPQLNETQKIEVLKAQKDYTNVLLQLVQTPAWQQKVALEQQLQVLSQKLCPNVGDNSFVLNPDLLVCVPAAEQKK